MHRTDAQNAFWRTALGHNGLPIFIADIGVDSKISTGGRSAVNI